MCPLTTEGSPLDEKQQERVAKRFAYENWIEYRIRTEQVKRKGVWPPPYEDPTPGLSRELSVKRSAAMISNTAGALPFRSRPVAIDFATFDGDEGTPVSLAFCVGTKPQGWKGKDPPVTSMLLAGDRYVPAALMPPDRVKVVFEHFGYTPPQ